MVTGNVRTLMGDEGQLIEILSEEDQELAVALMKATEATFSIETAQAYWWSGLKDEDDDGQWVWAGSNERIRRREKLILEVIG